MSGFSFLRLVVVTVLVAVVSVLLSKEADAGQYSHIIAIVVATDDGQQVTIPVEAVTDPALLKALPPLINKQLATPSKVSTTTTKVVCGPDGCREVEIASPASCPCGPDCACDPCNCSPQATPTTAAKTVVVTSQASTYHAAGPVRGALRKLGRFVVQGGPIRQAMRANRQARQARRGW